MREYGLIGYPLTHSSSKKIFDEKFEQENLFDCRFHLFPIKDVAEVFSLLNTFIYLKGLAVTIPYKETVIPLLDDISGEAKIIGAVNCIKINNGKLSGFNTDVVGFEKSFAPLIPAQAKKALILGTGGAAKAVEFVLQKLHINYLLVSRSKTNHNTIRYSDLTQEHITDYSIIINASPCGMSPQKNDAPPIPYEYLSADNYLYDLVYKPAKTLFLQKGEERGAVIKNGEDMLLIQAEENWRIWNAF